MPRPSLVAIRVACCVTLAAAAAFGTEACARAGQPAQGDPPPLKLRWEATLTTWADVCSIHFDADGTQLALISRQRIEAWSFNARTGRRGHELKHGTELPIGSPRNVYPLAKGKLGIQLNVVEEKSLILWDVTAGKVSRTAPYLMAGASAPLLQLSPDARYVTVWETKTQDGKLVDSPVTVNELKTGKSVLSTEWRSGHAFYTADATKVLLQDRDRFRWFKLPSGQPDGDWKLNPDPVGTGFASVHGLSADGGVILCYGWTGSGNYVTQLVNGKTGTSIHSFPPAVYASRGGSVSPDGEAVVLPRMGQQTDGLAIDVLDAKGKCLGQVKLPATVARANAIFTVSWEARAIAAFDRETKLLSVFDLPPGIGGAASAVRPVGRDVEGAGRALVPSDPAVGRAELAIRQVLKDEYARKGAADQKALAQKLLKMAEETADDLPARFVMLRDARDFAQAVADPALALQAVEGLAKWYQVDGQGLQLAALEKILAATATQATAKAVADAAALAAQASTLADELDDAVQFAQVAAAAVRKAKATQAAVDEADVNLALARKARDSFATIRQALDKLKATPDDPVANLQVGKYRCFVQNRWDEGLKHLAAGEDAALRAVAEVDLKAPRAGVPDDAKVADAWWEYAQSAPADFQWAAQSRTRYWYGRCIPGLTGLNKARAETRLAVAVGGTEYRPGLLCEFAAKQPAVLKGKKARLDTALDFSSDEFADAGKQTDLTVKWTGALVPTRGGRYTLAARTTDQVRIRVDGKVVIDTSVAAGRRDAPVVLGERATPIVVEYFAPNVAGHRIKLVWVPPGAAEEEVIPAECLFHDKKLESSLGK